ncbi:ATP-binding protein [Noviherbaspirillum sp. ST9]|uniref:hybrid sensor histidine kinase/response regulator n=1 Tax=Noviherbaspirillum sp. ST9 TaxID=3401606 RepID=UPI003B586D23
MRIRTRLLLLVLAVLVPAFLVAAFGIVYMYKEERAFHRENMRETVRALALVIDKEVARREALLQTLAASPTLDRGDFEAFYRYAQALAQGDAAIILHHINGVDQIINTRLPYGTPLPKLLPVARELRSRHPPDVTLITNLYMAPSGNGPSFGVQVPVKRDGKVVYYLMMGSTVKELQTVFSEQRLPREWHAGIVDRDGVLLARSKEPETYVGKQVRGDFAAALRTGEGFHEGRTLSGVPATAFFSRAPTSGWTFFVSVPSSVLKQPAEDAALLMAGISLFVIALTALAAIAVARRTARSVELLRRAAERLGRGEHIEHEHTGTLEIDAVNEAIAKAGEDIRNARASLEQRVAEAVASAERSQRALLQAQKLEALGRLTGGIAHDFNNVLQTVTTGLELARLRTTEPLAVSSLESCKRAVQRASELTRQLAVFGRVQDARLETIDPNRQLMEMASLLRSGLRADIDFQFDVPLQLWPVTVDPLQLELALLNLTINARDAMPEGGVLQLQARNETLRMQAGELAPGDYLRLTVADNGEGMSSEVLAKALDPFFTTKRVGKGSGMGLPQAYGFARQNGGTLILRSRPGEGTQAVLYLPRADRSVDTPRQDSRLPERKAGRETVLFVEDDPLVRDVVPAALQEAGFRVLCAADGEQALRMLDNGEQIDLLFTDIVMPGNLNGIELAQQARTRFPAVRVVLATGYTEQRVQLPDVRTLAKPYEVPQAVDALLDALGSR